MTTFVWMFDSQGFKVWFTHDIEGGEHDDDVTVVLVHDLPELVDVVGLVWTLDGDEAVVQAGELDQAAVGPVQIGIVLHTIREFDSVEFVCNKHKRIQFLCLPK